MVAIPDQIAMELLGDLQTANEHFLKDALPNFRCELRLERTPRPRLIIEYVGGDDDQLIGYPDFVKLSGVLRPTDYGRKLYGLPPKED